MVEYALIFLEAYTVDVQGVMHLAELPSIIQLLAEMLLNEVGERGK